MLCVRVTHGLESQYVRPKLQCVRDAHLCVMINTDVSADRFLWRLLPVGVAGDGVHQRRADGLCQRGGLQLHLEQRRHPHHHRHHSHQRNRYALSIVYVGPDHDLHSRSRRSRNRENMNCLDCLENCSILSNANQVWWEDSPTCFLLLLTVVVWMCIKRSMWVHFLWRKRYTNIYCYSYSYIHGQDQLLFMMLACV